MNPPKRRRRHLILLLKRPEKAGVVIKPAGETSLIGRHALQNQILAGQKPLLNHILVVRDSHFILKHMGQVVFIHDEGI